MKSLLVVGTNTGVGKTVVAALLALHFQSRAVDCGVMKPFASGCVEEDGVLVSEDAVFLQDMVGVADDLDLINPVLLAEPLTPLSAARCAGISSENFFAHARLAFDELQLRHDVVIVEGVGGLLAPIAQQGGRILTCRDLAEEWNLPVVIVARRTLGTINHTLLTIEALRGHAEIAGLVFCDAEPISENDSAAQTSPALIEEMCGVPVWGCVPFLTELSQKVLREVAGQGMVNVADFYGVI